MLQGDPPAIVLHSSICYGAIDVVFKSQVAVSQLLSQIFPWHHHCHTQPIFHSLADVALDSLLPAAS